MLIPWLILIAEMDSAGSNYPGAVPWWCLATLRPLFNRQSRRVFRGCSFRNKRLTRVNTISRRHLYTWCNTGNVFKAKAGIVVAMHMVVA